MPRAHASGLRLNEALTSAQSLGHIHTLKSNVWQMYRQTRLATV